MSFSSSGFQTLLGRDLRDLERAGLARMLADGLRWGEGPVWLVPSGRWIFSDIPNDRMFAWSEDEGISLFRYPSHFANGNALALDGSLLSCEHGERRISRTAPDGTYSVVCDSFEGRRLNSPNDLVAHSDGSIWFSDPTYGIISDVEGHRADPEQPASRVYRIGGGGDRVSAEIDGLKMPNGLCFSPDGGTLYVADSGADMGPEIDFDPDGPRDVYAYPVGPDGRVAGPARPFAHVSEGVPDGMRCDDRGCLWVATGAGAECFAPDGERLGLISTSETLANLAFGGSDGSEMMLTLASRVYLLTLPHQGTSA